MRLAPNGLRMLAGRDAAADKDGRKLAIFGDSLGSPEVDQWKVRIPALRYAMKNGHVVTLNQYERTINGLRYKLSRQRR